MSENLYWLWLSLNCNAEAGNLLLDTFSNPRQIFNASKAELQAALHGRYSRALESLMKKDIDEAKHLMSYCFSQEISIMTLGDSFYPSLLRQVNAPPLVLYYKGSMIRFDKELLVAVVGTRKITKYGESTAFQLAYDLARAGAIVVSGLAVGVDGVAAAGALAARGRTIAVLGSGLERIYPAKHCELFRRIVKTGGMVISEYPPYASPEKRHFPQRNRIISGMSLTALLIEGDNRSGAMITAEQAMHLGRRVFAVPGNIDAPTSFCSNWLIQNGAKAVTHAEDILDCFAESHKAKIRFDRLIPQCEVDREFVLNTLQVGRDGLSGGTYGPRERRKKKEPTPKKPISLQDDTVNEVPAVDIVVLPPSRQPKLKDASIPFGENAAEEGARVLREYLMYQDSEFERENREREERERRAAEEKEEKPKHDSATEAKLSKMPFEYVAVFNAVTDKGQTVEQIMNACGFSLSDVITALLALEVAKLVVSLPGARYKLAD